MVPHIHTRAGLSAQELDRILSAAYASAVARNEAEAKLQSAYLGFVVKRPLRHAPVGRPSDGDLWILGKGK